MLPYYSHREAHLQLMLLYSPAAFGREHDTSIVPQHMQALLSIEKVLGGALDARQVCKIHQKEVESAGARRVFPLQSIKRLLPLVFGTSSDVNFSFPQDPRRVRA